MLIMQNIGQARSLQAVIIRSPWSRQLGSEGSGLALNAHSLGIGLTLSCSLYEVLALISAAVTAAGSSAGVHLQKWLFSSVVKTAATAGKKYENQKGSSLPRAWFTWIYRGIANKICHDQITGFTMQRLAVNRALGGKGSVFSKSKHKHLRKELHNFVKLKVKQHCLLLGAARKCQNT